jgi:hypothetical protein
MAAQQDVACKPRIVWQPQAGPQKALIDCPVPEIFYGGARGGGKTDGVLGKFAILGEEYGRGLNAIFFRKELPMADDAMERAGDIFLPLGWKWNGGKYQWRSPAGARVRFRPLERVGDAEKYQGQNISHAAVEEAGNYPHPGPIDRLNGVLRSVQRMKTQLMLTGNPGGPGQLWIKERYVDPAPNGMQILTRALPNGRDHRYVFIPSKLQNNRILMANDPEYINRLYLVGSKELVKAWLDGDWNAIEGAFFDCWSLELVVAPFPVPAHWLRFRALDWGSARPFSVGWFCVSDGEPLPDGRSFPAGALIQYREWYGAESANVGVKMTIEQVADGIKERQAEGGERDLGAAGDVPHGLAAIQYGVADPAIFASHGGPSQAERFLDAGVPFFPGDNARVQRAGHMGGWDQLRQRMMGIEGAPMIYFFSTCINSLRTIPVLQHDPMRPEDLDTLGEDHAADMVRYAAMSRPWIAHKPAADDRRFPADRSINELVEANRRRRLRTQDSY